jgi:Tfp pilus assembly protein PilV
MQRLFSFARRPSRRPLRPKKRRGLTLLETSLATLIVGLSVLAITKLILAVTQQNFYAQKTTTALMLANNMRELMIGLPLSDPSSGIHLGPNTGQSTVDKFNDVEDFSGYNANPPIDANCQSISSLSNWKQSVTITHVTPGNNGFNLIDPSQNDQGVVLDRIKVTVSYSATPSDSTTFLPIVTLEWIKSKF